jgi:hypothetical protein
MNVIAQVDFTTVHFPTKAIEINKRNTTGTKFLPLGVRHTCELGRDAGREVLFLIKFDLKISHRDYRFLDSEDAVAASPCRIFQLRYEGVYFGNEYRQR